VKNFFGKTRNSRSLSCCMNLCREEGKEEAEKKRKRGRYIEGNPILGNTHAAIRRVMVL
jgi:hypothetical protein